jgi:hypothetical protein
VTMDEEDYKHIERGSQVPLDSSFYFVLILVIVMIYWLFQ